MRIVALNSAIIPATVETDDEWVVVPDACLFRDRLHLPSSAPDLYDSHVFIASASQLIRERQANTKDVSDQLSEMVEAGCILVCFADKPVNMGWLPRKIEARGGAGTELAVVPDTVMTEILNRYAREMSYGTQLNGWTPLALAPNRQSVAAWYQHGTGHMLVLPIFRRPHLVVRDILTTFIPNHANALVLRAGVAHSSENAPAWSNEFKVTGAEAIRAEVDDLGGQIDDLEKQREAKQRELETLNRFRELLWATGELWLEPLVRDALALMGVQGEPERPVDFVHRFGEDKELWIEVEGSKTCIQVDKGSQLLRYLADQPERAPMVTGAIIGNPYRLVHPAQRPPRDAQEGFFSRPLIDLADKQGWTLMTTRELFDLLLRHLAGDEGAARQLRSRLKLPAG